MSIGKIKIHGTILSNVGVNAANFAAALSGWMFVCAGEAVVAKFAEIYFKNELQAETPFTIGGAKELQRLGILVIAVSVFCNAAGVLVEGVISGFTNVEKYSRIYCILKCCFRRSVYYCFLALPLRRGA